MLLPTFDDTIGFKTINLKSSSGETRRLNQGDGFDVKLGKKAIRLIPAGGSEEEE